ncbi:MAG: sensor histidine kinase [Chitinophagaceae bacterium]|nr:sensor histidine kinase [Chitinophagaceae bacterium]
MQDQNQEILFLIVMGGLLALVLVGFIVTILFLYQRKQHKQEEELTRLKEEYDQELLKSQLEIQETTLKSIAQELHDNIGQVLSVVKLSLAVLPLEKEHQAYAPLQHIRDVLNKAVYDLADLTKSLHTDRIAQIGLVESIRFDLETLRKTGLMEVKFDLRGEEYRLGEQKEIFIFRIFQELVNNILKHAKATQLIISLNYTSEDVFLFSVKDNGVGFSLQEKKDSTSPLNGVGLKSMLNRSKLIGAKMVFNSQPGKGTTVNMEVPLSRA